MRYLRCARIPVFMITILLLLATPLINSANSNSQQTLVVNSIGEVVQSSDFGIFFEYGGETGVVQPPWDEANGNGVWYVDSTHARTGSKSLYMYQKAPPKDDYERRVHLTEQGSSYQKSEVYFSWWMYVDSQAVYPSNDWGPCYGGFQLFWGPTDEMDYWWHTDGRFYSGPSNNGQIWFGYDWLGMEDVDFSGEAAILAEYVATDHYLGNHLNEWVHFEVYWKMATSYTGAVKAWFNEDLVYEKTNIKTDPRGYSEWYSNPINGGECFWLLTETPDLKIELYQGNNSAENWIWVDDIVASTSRVPKSYGVLGK